MDFQATARAIVERVLRATVFDPAELDSTNWETEPLSTLISPGSQENALVAGTAAELALNLSAGDRDTERYIRDRFTLSDSGATLVNLVADFLKKAMLDRSVGFLYSGPADPLAGGNSSPQSPPPEAPAAPIRTGGTLYEPTPGAPQTPLPPVKDNATRVQVFFATDRQINPTGYLGERFGVLRSTSGTLNYGACEVSIPKIHKLGKLESPSFLRFEFHPDPEKHIVLSNVWSYTEQTFFEEVAASVAKSEKKDAFVFVHGYNVSFEDAARRTGQIAFDLNFVGAPIFYSWPSNDVVEDYLIDETNVAWSAPHLQRFLNLLAQYSGAQRINIIAHSMGNRAVCEALKNLSYDPANRLTFSHLVLAAPDIDADTFKELAAALEKISGRITMYQSSKDKALIASKKIHGYGRAGQPVLIVPGMDAIDASAVDTDFLGHSYFSDTWPLLSDIYSILLRDEPPTDRFGLVPVENADGKYFVFRA